MFVCRLLKIRSPRLRVLTSCWTKPERDFSPRREFFVSPSSPRKKDRGREGSINRDFPHLERPEVVNEAIEMVGSWEVRALEKTDAAFMGERGSSTARSLHANHPSRKWQHSVKGVAEKVPRELTKFPLKSNWFATRDF